MYFDNSIQVTLVHSSSEREAAEAVPIETRKMGGRKIGQAMQAEMDLLLQSSKRSGQATLISAPPGAGKTYFLVNQLFPAATARELTVLFVSSRVAINLQQKRALAKAIGQEELLNNLTAQGLQQQEQIGNVTIVTYQRLFQMFRDPERAAKLASVDLFVFDEVHALLHDATFVPYTDAIRRRVPEVFANASRIYLSATPQSTLLELRKAETAKKLVHYAFCEKYSYINPVFFHSWTDVAEEINRDKTGSKWLIFLPNIRMADAWRDKLKSDCQILTAQTRSSDPTLWNDLLENECFSSRVLLTTSVIDAGVNFHDKELVNIVSFSLDTEEIIQQVGRKRRTSKQDKVKLYVHEPSRQTVNHRLFRVREMISQLELTSGTASPLFVESLLLREHRIHTGTSAIATKLAASRSTSWLWYGCINRNSFCSSFVPTASTMTETAALPRSCCGRFISVLHRRSSIFWCLNATKLLPLPGINSYAISKADQFLRTSRTH